MAEAAGHKFGQFIGEYCEKAMEPLLQKFADDHGLYLDKKGKRAARKGVKLSWIDENEFGHDLDYVLERGGTPSKIGTPVAFIESAWRRYTKHSKNKAQEITGAVLPIAGKHRFSAPLMGCILAGEYTTPALEQLRGLGFKVLHLGYDSVVAAFKSVGIDARFNEKTSEQDLLEKKRQWNMLPARAKASVWDTLVEANRSSVDEFLRHLEHAVKRQITAIRIIPLHGSAADCLSIAQAISFVENYDEQAAHGPLVKYEVIIRYDDAARIEAFFDDRVSTIEFLEAYISGNYTPVTDLDDEVE